MVKGLAVECPFSRRVKSFPSNLYSKLNPSPAAIEVSAVVQSICIHLTKPGKSDTAPCEEVNLPAVVPSIVCLILSTVTLLLLMQFFEQYPYHH
mgnify:CR=1 FL=1